MSFTEQIQTVYWPTLQVVWPSLLAAASVSCAGAVVGTFVALRREALMALAMPQIVTLGAAVGLRLNIPTVLPAIGLVGAAMGLAAGSDRQRKSGLILPVLYVAGAALSVLLVADMGAELIEIRNMFNGIDVAVSIETAIWTAILLGIVTLICAVFWRRWMLLAQAHQSAELAGARPHLWNAFFLLLLALLIAVGTNAVGSLMVVIMLFVPPAIILPWAKRVPMALACAMILALLSLIGGFILSVDMDWPLSHSAGGIAVAMFILSSIGASIFAT